MHKYYKMIKTLFLNIMCVVFVALGFFVFSFTCRHTFDGDELMIMAVIAGFGLYLVAFFTIDKKLAYGIFEPVVYVGFCVILTSVLHFFTISEDTFQESSQILGKERERLRNGSFSHYLIVNTPRYGEQKIWVTEVAFNSLNAGEYLTLTLSEGVLGYRSVVGYANTQGL